MDLLSILKAAAPLGGGVAVVMFAMAVLSRSLRDRSRERRLAIARAAPQTLPRLLGDEIDKLGLSAAGLENAQRYDLVTKALEQRERRHQRAFVVVIVVVVLLAAVTTLGLVVPAPSKPQQQTAVAPDSRSASHSQHSSAIQASDTAPGRGSDHGNDLEVADAKVLYDNGGFPFVDVVLRNRSAGEVLITMIEIRPTADVRRTAEPPRGPLLETSATYSVLLDGKGVGVVDHLRVTVPGQRHERLLIAPRLGILEKDRVVAPLTADGDVLATIQGRFTLTYVTSADARTSHTLELTIPCTFGSAEPLAVTVPEQVAALSSNSVTTVINAVDLFALAGDDRACSPLKSLQRSELTELRKSLSSPVLDPETLEQLPEEDTGHAYREFQQTLAEAIEKSCTKPQVGTSLAR